MTDEEGDTTFDDGFDKHECIGEMPVARARKVVETLMTLREGLVARVIRTRKSAPQGFVGFVEKELKKVNTRITKIDKLIEECNEILKGLE